MPKKDYKYGKSLKINLNSVRIGGGAYAVLRNAEQKQSDKQKQTEAQQEISKIESITPENAERRKHIESIKDSIRRTHYWWMDLFLSYDDYNLTEDEYFEIAKFAIDLYPLQMNRVRVDKLSANNYYEICKVAAKHGVIQDIQYDYLSKAKIKNVKNPVFDIMKIALDSKNSVYLQINIAQQLKSLGENAKNFIRYYEKRERQ